MFQKIVLTKNLKRPLLFQKNKKHPAYMLVEILFVTLMTSAMCMSLTTALKQAADLLTMSRDSRAMQNRATAVITLLRNPIFNCAMGLPLDPNEYREAFGNSSYVSFYWQGPISAVKSPTGKISGELRIAYAKPAYIKLASDVNYPDDGNTLYLDKAVEINALASRSRGGPGALNECVLFKNSFPRVNPLIVRWINGSRKSLEVDSLINSRFKLYKGDMLHLLYAYRVFAKSGTLYTQDYRMSGEQPRVDGISDIRFDVDKDKRTVTVYLLVRGDHVFPECQKVEGAESWPGKFSDGAIYADSNYRRKLLTFTWGLPNCMSEKIFKGKNVTDL